MGLTQTDRAAGAQFKFRAQHALDCLWVENRAAAQCSPQVRFYRHECPAVDGRTRSVRLEDRTYTSPEMWVDWNKGNPQVYSEAQANERLARGMVAEYETVLAGRFAFTWKTGECKHCHLTVMSREGVLKDLRPAVRDKDKAGDLAVFAQGPLDVTLTPAIKREHDLI
jgi:hypothetical protein